MGEIRNYFKMLSAGIFSSPGLVPGELTLGVVGWCEGVMYLVSPGRPTDIGLQLGKACYR